MKYNKTYVYSNTLKLLKFTKYAKNGAPFVAYFVNSLVFYGIAIYSIYIYIYIYTHTHTPS
jgi:hypothetical protein